MKFILVIIFSCFSYVFANITPQNSIEQTLSIIKPDAVAAHHIGAIIERFENAGLHVVAAKMTRLTLKQAEQFYGIHRERPFFKDLVTFMISGPIFVQVLEGNNAVTLQRQLMGATNPLNAAPGTIRAEFGTDVQRNAVHGSDSLDNAKKEIAFFFKSNEIFSNR